MRTNRHDRRKPGRGLRNRDLSALARLEAGLQTQDEAAWYAERIERLGRLMFGDSWRTEERKDVPEPSETP